MKSNHKFLRLAAAGMAVIAVACAHEDESVLPAAPEAELEIYPGNAEETRVTLNGTSYSWQETDLAGIYIDATTPTTNSRGTLKRNASNEAYFSATVKASKAGNKVYAYYPYTSVNPKIDNYLNFTLPSKQTQTKAGVFNGSQLPMAACAAELTQDLAKNSTASLTLKFSPVAAIAEFSVWSSNAAYAGEKIHSVTFSSDATKLSSGEAGGGLKVDANGLLGGTIDCDATGLTGSSVMVSIDEPFAPATSAATGRSAYLVVPAVKATGTLRTVVRTDAAFYEFTADKGAVGVTFARNSVKRFSLDLDKAVRTEAVMPSVTVSWLPDEKVAQESGSSLYNVPFVLSPSAGCVSVYYDYLQKNSLPADLETDLLATGTKVTQWTDGIIRGVCEGILATAGESPWVIYAIGVGSDGSRSEVVTAELNPAMLDPSLSEGPFYCVVKTRINGGAEYGNEDRNMPYKEVGGTTIYYIKNGYDITASANVVSYKMYWGMYELMRTMSDTELIALANREGSATVIVAQENPKELPLYMVDFERTATTIVWKDQAGAEHLFKGHVIRSYRNGEFVSTGGWD